MSLGRYRDRFFGYLWSKSKVVLNRAEFWTFIALPNFKVVVPPIVVYIVVYKR